MTLQEGRVLVTVIVHQVVDGRTRTALINLEGASLDTALETAKGCVLAQLRLADVAELPAGQLDDSLR